MVIDGDPFKWCTGDYTFIQYLYENSTLENKCICIYYNIIKYHQLAFYVNGLRNKYIIDNNNLSTYDCMINISNPTIIQRTTNLSEEKRIESYIRYIAKTQCREAKWWQFWKW